MEDSVMAGMRAVRRLGREADEETTGATGSTDIVELHDGDFAVVGRDVTGDVDLSLLPGVHSSTNRSATRPSRTARPFCGCGWCGSR